MADRQISRKAADLSQERIEQAKKDYPKARYELLVGIALLRACEEILIYRSAQIASPTLGTIPAREPTGGPTGDGSGEPVGMGVSYITCPGCERKTELYPDKNHRIKCSNTNCLYVEMV